ncbi:MAG TPA: hypothetical protein VFW02_09595 [Candidatus Limnocylindrales bacterium]|nr:hypothetical protein [Candidatus Limnocylindrales bacterium]
MMPTARLVRPLFVLALAACTTTPGGSPSPTPTPTTADFTIDVRPSEEPSAIRMAIPGSRYCFLVLVDDPSGSTIPVTIEASTMKATVLDISPAELAPGVVGEVCVAADPTSVETTGAVTITASRGGVQKTVERSLPVFPMADERATDAQPYFERWAAWLAAEHPELGITADTDWEPVFVSTLLVVSHYSYWSTDWEMTVAWHVMIAPDDWTEVHLRRRGVDMAPSMAFRIESVSGETDPIEVDPPTEVVR